MIATYSLLKGHAFTYFGFPQRMSVLNRSCLMVKVIAAGDTLRRPAQSQSNQKLKTDPQKALRPVNQNADTSFKSPQ